MLGPRRGPAYKTKLCALWQRGRCSRASCSFAHGDAELRRLPSFPPHPELKGCGRRDYRDSDLRDKLGRRYSPRRRYSPGRDTRGHRSLHDERPGSRERGSSYSRSPSRKSERKHRRKLDDEKSNSSRSLSISDNNEDRKKEDKFSSGDEKDDLEKQLKQVRHDMEVLLEDKSQLESILDQKLDEVHKVSSRINDLEMELRREKEECQRMTSKMKKFIKAHARFVKAQEELKRSQARFERLGDLLASDTLKRVANEEGIGVNVDEPIGAYERSPSDQQQLHVSAANKKRSGPYSTSEEGKAVKKMRERDSDMITSSEKYKPEGAALEFDKISKGAETTRSLSVKRKLGEDEKNKQGNIVSSSNIFADKVKGSQVKHVLPSTGMAAHAVDDLIEAVEMEDKHEMIDASIENDVGDRTKSSYMPPPPPPAVQNAYKQYEGEDEEVDVE